MPYRDHKGICANGFYPEGANPFFIDFATFGRHFVAKQGNLNQG